MNNESKLFFLIFAKVGGGKKHLVRHLMEERAVLAGHLETGEIMRQIAKGDSPLAIQIRQIQDKREMVDDTITFDIVSNELKTMRQFNLIFMDGFPRTLKQWEVMKYHPDFQGHAEIIYIDRSNEFCIQKALWRAEKEGRTDGSIEKTKKGIEIFGSQTVPVIHAMVSAGIPIHHIKTDGDIEKEITDGYGLWHKLGFHRFVNRIRNPIAVENLCGNAHE